jgi:hypothetical protein
MFVFGDAKIGARSWKSGVSPRDNTIEAPTCIIADLLRTQLYTSGTESWGVIDNQFTVDYGYTANQRADVWFGLSNRVRSVNVVIEGLSGLEGAAAAANNTVRVNLWKISPQVGAAEDGYNISTTPNYPTDQLLLRVGASQSGGTTTIVGTTSANVNIKGGDDFLHGCGFAMHLESRIGGSDTAYAHWRVTITPSETPLP